MKLQLKQSQLKYFLTMILVMVTFSVWGQVEKVRGNPLSEQLTGEQLILRGLDYIHKQNKPDSALIFFASAANRRFNQSVMADSVETAACAEALNLLGVTFEKAFFDFQKAYYYYLKAEQFAKEHGYKEVLPNIHNNMAGLLSYKESSNKRGKYNSYILKLYRNAFHEAWEAKVYNVLGVIAVNMSIRALDWNMVDSVRNELQLYGKGGFKALFFEHHRSICDAVLACAEGKYDKGLLLLDKALGLDFGFSNLDKGPDSALVYHIKSNILFRLGNDEDALKQIDKVIELSKRWNDHVDLCEVYDRLSMYYRGRHEVEAANNYELLYLREKDYLMNNAKLAGLDYSKLLLEIEHLTNEAEMMAMRDSLKSNVLILVSAFSMLVICILLLLYRKYKQVRENNRRLYQKSLEMIHSDEEKRLLIEKLEEQLSHRVNQQKAEPKEVCSRKGEGHKSDLLHRIFIVMETSDEIFSSSFCLPRLAELVGDKRNNVSEAINQQYKTNFNGLINEYRIKEACRRMNDVEHYGNLTIEFMANDLGFKSRNTFTTVFKQIVGLTPSTYLKLAKQR